MLRPEPPRGGPRPGLKPQSAQQLQKPYNLSKVVGGHFDRFYYSSAEIFVDFGEIPRKSGREGVHRFVLKSSADSEEILQTFGIYGAMASSE